MTTTLIPETGRSTLPFIDPQHPDRPIEVNFYRPVDHGPDDPVVIVQHGMLRNGDEYRDFWIPAADKHRILIVAPTFPTRISRRPNRTTTDWSSETTEACALSRSGFIPSRPAFSPPCGTAA